MSDTKTTEAQKRAVANYKKNHLKRIPFEVKKSSYEQLKAAADAAGESVSGYIKNSIAMRMGIESFDLIKPDDNSDE